MERIRVFIRKLKDGEDLVAVAREVQAQYPQAGVFMDDGSHGPICDSEGPQVLVSMPCEATD